MICDCSMYPPESTSGSCQTSACATSLKMDSLKDGNTANGTTNIRDFSYHDFFLLWRFGSARSAA